MRDGSSDSVTPGGPSTPLGARGATGATGETGATGATARDDAGAAAKQLEGGPALAGSAWLLLAILLVSLVVYAAIAADVVNKGRLTEVDESLSEWVARSMPAWAEWIARPFTWTGGVVGVTLLVAVAVVWLLRRGERLLAGRELASDPDPEAVAGLRRPIVESWRRALDTALDPVDLLAPIEGDEAEMQERWAEHPLGSLARVVVDQLEAIAGESQSLIVVSDASGLLLHIEGPASLKARAAEMPFASS